MVEQPLDKPYGWRARIGFIVPGVVDETVPYEFYRVAPPGVILVLTHLSIRELTLDQIDKALAIMDQAVDELGRRKVDIIGLGGSPPVIFGGVGSDEKIIARIKERTGIPGFTAQTAAVSALRALGVGKLAVAAPFPDELNQLLKKFLEGSGFQVLAIRGAGRPYHEIPNFPLSLSYNLAKAVVQDAPGVEGVYIPGAPFPAMANLQRLEQELGIPVVSSFQATMWHCFRTLGIKEPIQGYGRLLTLL